MQEWQEYLDLGVPKTAIANILGISVKTLYRRLEERENKFKSLNQ